ncbi:MAG: (2Fe-2S)-binding protein [Gemmataceae bacterium]|nr:(2Fe-2S)-binding protein [Gemmataceae bacterium]MCI0740307.1 (2Fe-2S)-binding protein [Gemmataceae bacterium]
MDFSFSNSDPCHACPERVLCQCLNITEEDVVRAINTLGLQSLRDVRRHTGAGDGCTCCHARIKECLERYSLTLVSSS